MHNEKGEEDSDKGENNQRSVGELGRDGNKGKKYT